MNSSTAKFGYSHIRDEKTPYLVATKSLIIEAKGDKKVLNI